MELQHWQAQFENWLKNHHQHQDAAHDLSFSPCLGYGTETGGR